MKNSRRLNFLLLIASLSLAGAMARADDSTPVRKFEVCVSKYLLDRFMPSWGNVQYFSNPDTRFDILKDEEGDAPARVAFVPNWGARAKDAGQYDTRNGSRPYEEVTELNATGSFDRDDQSLEIFYKHWLSSEDPDGNGKDNVIVRLAITSGIPYVTADRVTQQNCRVDVYGRNDCDDPTVEFSNFRVVIPASYQPQAYWVNSETEKRTKFAVDMSAYLSCLQQI